MRKLSLIIGILLTMFVMFPVAETLAAGEIVSENKSLCDEDSGVSEELKKQAGCKLSEKDTAPSVIQNLINVVVGVIGIGAVAAMIYGGFVYTTSTGDTGKTTKAKNIIIYGAVGLLVAIMAFAIVQFVSASIGGGASGTDI